MNCLFKLFLLLFASVLALVIVAVGGLWLVGNYAPSQIEKGIERRTDFALDLGQTRLRPLDGVVELSNARLANPPEFSSPDFLDIERLRVDFDTQSLQTEELHFEELTLVLRRFAYVVREDGRNNVEVFAERLAGEGREDAIGLSHRPYRIDRVLIQLDELLVDTPGAEPGEDRAAREIRINSRLEATDVTDLESLLEPLLAELRAAGVELPPSSFLGWIPFEGVPSLLPGLGKSIDQTIESFFRRKDASEPPPSKVPSE